MKEKGFTLIELLVVIAVISILAGILLPAIAMVRRHAKITVAENTINKLAIALEAYKTDWGTYPPDYWYDTANSRYVDPGEALYHCLVNGYGGRGPYFEPAEGYIQDFIEPSSSPPANDGLPTLLDPWGVPYLYNRGPFPSGGSNFPYSSARPQGRPRSFDLYSLGPDGQTSNGRVISFRDDIEVDQYQINASGQYVTGSNNVPDFYDKALYSRGNDRYGEGTDDIRNWVRP